MIRGSIDDDTVSICDGFTVPAYFTQKTFFKFSKAMLGFFWVETCGKKDLYLFCFFWLFASPIR